MTLETAFVITGRDEPTIYGAGLTADEAWADALEWAPGLNRNSCHARRCTRALHDTVIANGYSPHIGYSDLASGLLGTREEVEVEASGHP